MGEDEPRDMEHCVEILTNGYVQSFVDFFYLMHSDPAKENQEASNFREESKDAHDGRNLKLIKEKLTGAEKARRSGAPNLVFENYRDLGTYFCDTGDFQTGTCFYEKCLKIAQLVNDSAGEKEALYKLGLAMQKVPGETQKAIEYHERHMELAEKMEDEEATSMARKQLAIVYDKRASELEKSKDPATLAQVVELLDSCVRIFADEKDLKGKANANFRLGCVYNLLNKPDRAIVALSQNYDYCEKNRDIQGQGKTCASLAAAYLQVENKTQKAIEYLEQCLHIAQQTHDIDMQAFASRSLGSVHFKMGENDKAVHYFEQNFDLVRKKSRTELTEIDKARVLMGLALKNARRQDLNKMIQNDLFALLHWKASHQFQT